MISSVVLLVGLSILSKPLAWAQTCTPCDDVHFFLARGNNEPYPGRQGDLVAATCKGLSSCGYENLIYSALYTDLSCQTTYDGTIAGITQLTSYAERCPNSKLILAGYSQGAQIASDILGGGGGVSFNGCVQPSTPPLDPATSPGNRLSAVILFGNTRHTANQPYNYGNGSSYDGLFPRSGAMLPALDAYAGIMRDWCLQTDPICAANQTDSEVSTHLGYYNRDSDAAASWIKSVASLTDNSNFQTTIPTSVSGTAQDYSTIGAFTPSGTVTTAATTAPAINCGNATTTASASTTSASASRSNSTTSSTSLSTSAPLVTITGTRSTTSTSNTASITSPPSSSIPSPSASVETPASATGSSTPSGASSSHVSHQSFAFFLALLVLVML